MEDVHYLEADGTEVYGIYKHDVCYMEKDGIQRTLADDRAGDEAGQRLHLPGSPVCTGICLDEAGTTTSAWV